MADHLLVLKGRPQSVALEDLLQVVGVSRQCLCVETEDAQGGVLGSVWIKSGFVLSVRAADLTGRPAFRAFLRNPDIASYSVYRPRQERTDYGTPLGAVAELLLETAIEADESVTTPALDLPAPPPLPVKEPPRVDEAAAPSRRSWIVGFSSGKGGSGKTTVTLNVGLALAETGQSVLLVDADPLGGLRHSVLGDQPRGTTGLFDVLMGRVAVGDAILTTRVPSLSLLPAGTLGPREATEHAAQLSSPAAWSELLGRLSATYPLLLVDLPAGLHGIAAGVLGACSHTFAVLEAEPLALRVLPQLLHTLEEQHPGEGTARLAGIILNNVQFRSGTSLGVVQGAWTGFAEGLVLETSVPRDPLILEASEKGVPVAFLDRVRRPPIAAVFRHLAEDVAERIGLVELAPAGEPLRLL